MKRVSSLSGKIHTLSGENAGSPIMIDEDFEVALSMLRPLSMAYCFHIG